MDAAVEIADKKGHLPPTQTNIAAAITTVTINSKLLLPPQDIILQLPVRIQRLLIALEVIEEGGSWNEPLMRPSSPGTTFTCR